MLSLGLVCIRLILAYPAVKVLLFSFKICNLLCKFIIFLFLSFDQKSVHLHLDGLLSQLIFYLLQLFVVILLLFIKQSVDAIVVNLI